MCPELIIRTRDEARHTKGVALAAIGTISMILTIMSYKCPLKCLTLYNAHDSETDQTNIGGASMKRIPFSSLDVLELDDGAKFWGYISPQRSTEKIVTKWTIRLEHTTSNWVGEITHRDPPGLLTTPGLSGIFNVKVTVSGPRLPEQTIECEDYSRPEIGCNSNCASMVGIVATEAGDGA